MTASGPRGADNCVVLVRQLVRSGTPRALLAG